MSSYIFSENHRNLRDKLCSDGVNNHSFFLQMNRTELMDIDPYIQKLTEEQRVDIINECIENPWYFLRMLKVYDVGSRDLVRYNIDKTTVASWYLFIHGVDGCTAKPRQQCNTLDALIKALYVNLFDTQTIHLYSKDITMTKEMLFNKITQWIVKALPTFLKEKFDPSRIICHGAEDALDAMNVNPEDIHIFNDVDSIVGIEGTMWRSLRTSPNKYGNVFVSAPVGNEDFDKFVDESTRLFNDHEYDIVYLMVDKLSPTDPRSISRGLFYINYQWTELGITWEWMLEMFKILNYDWNIIAKELFCIRKQHRTHARMGDVIPVNNMEKVSTNNQSV